MEKGEISFEAAKRNLPDDWKWVKLRQISRLVSGSTPHRGTSENFNGKIPWIKTLDLNCSVVRQAQECISELAFSQIRGEILPIGTVMVAMYGGAGTIGKSGILGLPATTNQAICSILPNPEVFVPEFLHSWLILIRSEWMQYSSGNRRDPNINKEVVGNMYFPLPPLNEQKRIAAILNEQMEAVEKAGQNAIAQLEAAKELPAAYLRAVFDSPEAHQWDTKKLGEVADIVAGITLGNRHNKTNTRSIPYLRVANVKDGYLDLADVYQIEATETEIEKLCLRYGDILLTEGGDPDKLGRGTFWQEEIAECIHQNHIFRVRFDFNEFCPKFISAQIGSPYGKAYFLAHAKQTTGIATINRQVLSNFPLLIPSLFEQKRIAASISEKLTEAEQLRKILKEQLEAIKKLSASLLRQAFNGEL